MSGPSLLTVPGAADRLGVSTRTVRVLIAARRIAVVRVTSRCIRIEEAELARFVAEHREEARR